MLVDFIGNSRGVEDRRLDTTCLAWQYSMLSSKGRYSHGSPWEIAKREYPSEGLKQGK